LGMGLPFGLNGPSLSVVRWSVAPRAECRGNGAWARGLLRYAPILQEGEVSP
jgi:hypothetical protein